MKKSVLKHVSSIMLDDLFQPMKGILCGPMIGLRLGDWLPHAHTLVYWSSFLRVPWKYNTSSMLGRTVQCFKSKICIHLQFICAMFLVCWVECLLVACCTFFLWWWIFLIPWYVRTLSINSFVFSIGWQFLPPLDLRPCYVHDNNFED